MNHDLIIHWDTHKNPDKSRTRVSTHTDLIVHSHNENCIHCHKIDSSSSVFLIVCFCSRLSIYLFVCLSHTHINPLFDLSTRLRIYWLFPLRRITTLPKKDGILDDSKLHLMMGLQFWRFGKFGEPFRYHYSQVHSNPKWSLMYGSNRSIIKLFLIDRIQCNPTEKQMKQNKTVIKNSIETTRQKM